MQKIDDEIMQLQKGLIKLANKGYAEAQCRLADAYYYGWAGLAIDEEKAAYWYTKAAEQGHELAAICLNNIKEYTIKAI